MVCVELGVCCLPTTAKVETPRELYQEVASPPPPSDLDQGDLYELQTVHRNMSSRVFVWELICMYDVLYCLHVAIWLRGILCYPGC